MINKPLETIDPILSLQVDIIAAVNETFYATIKAFETEHPDIPRKFALKKAVVALETVAQSNLLMHGKIDQE